MRFAFALVVLLAATAPAFAHAFLDHAEPGAGAVLSHAPQKVVLKFTESLSAVFSGVNVTDAADGDETAGAVSVDGNAMTVRLKALTPGRYRVVWHAVSVDAHRTEGAYTFSVK